MLIPRTSAALRSISRSSPLQYFRRFAGFDNSARVSVSHEADLHAILAPIRKQIVRQISASWRVILLALLVGSIVAWLSLSHTFSTRHENISNLSAILAGEPLHFNTESVSISAFYNRVLFAGAHSFVSEHLTFLSASQWYILLRVASFMAAFTTLVVGATTVLKSDPQRAMLAMCLLAFSVCTTFVDPWENPTDALDIICQVAGVLLAMRGRYLGALLIAVAFSANRESAAYLGPIWFILAPVQRPWAKVAQSAGLTIASLLTVVALRATAGSDSGIGNWITIDRNVEFLSEAIGRFQPTNWLGLFLIAVCSMLCCLDFSKKEIRGLIALAAIFAVPPFLFGFVKETRVFIPSFVMLALAVASPSNFRERSRTGDAGVIAAATT